MYILYFIFIYVYFDQSTEITRHMKARNFIDLSIEQPTNDTDFNTNVLLHRLTLQTNQHAI